MSSYTAPHLPAPPPSFGSILSAHSPTPFSEAILRRPWLSGLLLVASDLLALSLAFWSSVLIWMQVKNLIHPIDYVPLWPALLAFLAAYQAAGLYPAIALHPAEELRRCFAATTCVYFLLGTMSFMTRESEIYSRAVFSIALMQTWVLIPLFRYLAKTSLAKRKLWGCATVIVGAGPSSQAVIDTLRRDPGIGLHPIAIVDDLFPNQETFAGLPLISIANPQLQPGNQSSVPYAIVSHSRQFSAQDSTAFLRVCEQFSNVLVIPDLFKMSTLWVEAVDLGGMLGLETRQKLLRSSAQLVKRIADLVLTVLLGLLFLPLSLIVSLLIKWSSPGPLFYGHIRCGRNGVRFRAWKFRTMVPNADRILELHLDRNPSLKSEWIAERKLRADPRVTAVGHFLRRTSLDELPQLWNVLKGEMSLVGPRPIVEEEIFRYREDFHYYDKVRPGITGLWQVSGRNRLTYQERIRLDAYYVRNWSPWLDLFILARTIKVVLTADGAW